MTGENRPCPECRGNGIIVGYACPGFRVVETPCLFCGGEGVVTPEKWAQRERGAQLRNIRVYKLNISLRQASEKTGYKPLDLSMMECGRMPPTEDAFNKYLALEKEVQP